MNRYLEEGVHNRNTTDVIDFNSLMQVCRQVDQAFLALSLSFGFKSVEIRLDQAVRKHPDIGLMTKTFCNLRVFCYV